MEQVSRLARLGQQPAGRGSTPPIDAVIWRPVRPATTAAGPARSTSSFAAPASPSLAPGSGGADSSGVQEYHAECSSAEIASCVPACNAEHHGFELLATIDGTDTKFSCNLAHMLYSWMGAASEGGYLGADFAAFFSAVVSGAAGSYFLALTMDAGISTDLKIQPGQDVRIHGDSEVPPSWGRGGFAVQQGGSVSLTNVGVDATAAITVTGGGSLSLAELTLPQSALYAVMGGSGAGSRLVFESVTVPEHPEWGMLTGSATKAPYAATGNFPLPTFVVNSGPCTLAEGGRCVGRWPGGYLPNEVCRITVSGSGGPLGDCPIFDTGPGHDFLYLGGECAGDDECRPYTIQFGGDGSAHTGSQSGPYASDPACPAGSILAGGQTLSWSSDGDTQGCRGDGLPQSESGAGGGWQICFA